MSDMTIVIKVGAPETVVVTAHDLVATAGIAVSRRVDSGAGLTGGGDLSTDRTFAVGANVDGSITVNANDIQVGVLATDAQHGNRGGGLTHPAVVSAGAAGFMTGADKAALDKLSDLTTRIFNVVKDGGAIPNVNSTPAKAANDAAFAAAMDNGGRIFVPRGVYYTGAAIDVDSVVWMEGEGGFGAVNGVDGIKTRIAPPPGVCGLIIHRPDTSPGGGRGDGSVIAGIGVSPSVSTPAWTSGAKSLGAVVCSTSSALSKRGVVFVCTTAGTTGGSEPTWNATPGTTTTDGSVTWTAQRASGILMFARAQLSNCAVYGMGGHGLEIFGYSSGGPGTPGNTNANGWRLFGFDSILNKGDGINVDGSDANAGFGSALNIMNSGRYGVLDSSELGNAWEGLQVADSGMAWFKQDDPNAQITLTNPYSESGQPGGEILGANVVSLGGLNAAGWASGLPRGIGPYDTPFAIRNTTGMVVRVGRSNSSAIVSAEPAGGATTLEWRYADGWYLWSESGLDSRTPMQISGDSAQTGRPAGTLAFGSPFLLGFGDSVGGIARVFTSKVIPSDPSARSQIWSVGDFVLNTGADNSIIAWKCTTAGTGTASIWVALNAG